MAVRHAHFESKDAMRQPKQVAPGSHFPDAIEAVFCEPVLVLVCASRDAPPAAAVSVTVLRECLAAYVHGCTLVVAFGRQSGE